MTTNLSKARGHRIVVAALLFSGVVGYAAAQQQPMNHGHEPAPDDHAMSCPHECTGDCMKGGGMMHGMHDEGGTHEGMSCPMMGMHALADVKIENTKSGVVIRLNAKKADQVAQVQAMAARMKGCMGMDAPPNAKEPQQK